MLSDGLHSWCRECWKDYWRKRDQMRKTIKGYPVTNKPTKVCILCGETKPIKKFERDNRCVDGVRGKCRRCQDTGRKYAAKRKTLEERRKRANEMKRRKEKTPEGRMKKLAQKALHGAVKRGTVKRKPCEVCGSRDSQAHHDDYSKRFDVKWLCRRHHMARHRKYAFASAV